MKNNERRPSEFHRVIWIFAALPACILLIGPSDLFSSSWWEVQQPSDRAAVAFAALLGLGLGILSSRDIWKMITRHPPLWKLFLTVGTALAVLFGAIVLRESGIWVWALAEADALISMWCFTIALAAVITERKRNVRVYFGRHYLFVDASSDA